MYFYGGYFYSNVSGKEDKRHIANYEIGLNEKYNTYFINGSFPIKMLNTNLNIEIGIGYSLNKLIDINVGLRYLFNGVMSYEIGEIEDKDVLFIYPFNYYYYRKISMGKVNWEERKKESDELWKENKISEVNWQEE